MKFIYLFSILVLVFLFACARQDDQTQLGLDNASNLPVELIEISCDDGNQCTEDFYNTETMNCEYKRLDYCCGDGFCDQGERCNEKIHETICPDDCSRTCPAFVTVGEFECSGDCEKKQQGNYTVYGDSKFIVNLENTGELSLYNIKSKANCKNDKGVIILSNNNKERTFGILVKDYFGKDEDVTFLNGKYFTKNKIDYFLEFNGGPEKDLSLDCSINFIATDYFYNTNLNITFISGGN